MSTERQYERGGFGGSVHHGIMLGGVHAECSYYSTVRARGLDGLRFVGIIAAVYPADAVLHHRLPDFAERAARVCVLHELPERHTLHRGVRVRELPDSGLYLAADLQGVLRRDVRSCNGTLREWCFCCAVSERNHLLSQ